MELSSAFVYGCCSIQDGRGGDLCPGYADLGSCDIPCMAGELLQHILANEQLHLSPTWCACPFSTGRPRRLAWTGISMFSLHVHACVAKKTAWLNGPSDRLLFLLIVIGGHRSDVVGCGGVACSSAEGSAFSSLGCSLSSSQLSSLCCAKSPPATPEITEMLTPPPPAASHPALAELASVGSFVTVDSFQAVAKHVPMPVPEPEAEQHDYLSTGAHQLPVVCTT